MQYSFSVKWSDEEQQYVGLCKEFPHLSHFDNSESDAQKGIADLVDAAVGILKEKNLPIPKPSN